MSCLSEASPRTAPIGDTFAHLRAGEAAASSTHIRLTLRASANGHAAQCSVSIDSSSLSIVRITANITCIATIVPATPTGAAIPHVIKASQRTIERILLRLAPRQRSMPNCCSFSSTDMANVLRTTIIIMPSMIEISSAQVMISDDCTALSMPCTLYIISP